MISALLHIIIQKLFEVARTPGIGNKLAALFVGQHKATSIAGIVGFILLIASAAIAENQFAVVVDWQLVTTLAAGVLLGGRAARRRGRKGGGNLPTTKAGMEAGVAEKPSASDGRADLSKAETKRVFRQDELDTPDLRKAEL